VSAVICNVCEWRTEEPVRVIAQAEVVWHVHDEHPDVWLEVIGDRPPEDPDVRIPEVRARMLAGKES
jgi:hypothetical protein